MDLTSRFVLYIHHLFVWAFCSYCFGEITTPQQAMLSIQPEMISVTRGGQFQLNCTRHSTYSSSTTFIWWLGETMLASGNRSQYPEVSVHLGRQQSRITVEPVGFNHSGHYSCGYGHLQTSGNTAIVRVFDSCTSDKAYNYINTTYLFQLEKSLEKQKIATIFLGVWSGISVVGMIVSFFIGYGKGRRIVSVNMGGEERWRERGRKSPRDQLASIMKDNPIR
ncbi:uncharacterized protein LOC141908392 [Tubulanus polymorphus]|uniref:uncharacterized protein LOC141908392 n=1 Tax=Tubulanus polymorphus TaxID=672921 RepID=UPI003DA3CD92